MQNNNQPLTASAAQQQGTFCTSDSAAVARGVSKDVQTTTDLYDWEVESCRLQFRPNLSGCYSMLDAFEHLQHEFVDWFVEFAPGKILLSRAPHAEPMLVLVEKGATP